MIRKAILFFNDGGLENYLPGVSIDKSNYLDFLESPEGGAWDDRRTMASKLAAILIKKGFPQFVFALNVYIKNQ